MSSKEQNLDHQMIALKEYVPEENILVDKASGKEAAQKKGKHLGRPERTRPANFEIVYVEWKRGRITASKAMKLLGVPKTTFYRIVRQFESVPKS